MASSIESVTVTLPRAMIGEIPSLARGLNDRMHELLERNTDGSLTATERAELETLVHMAQFAQILAVAFQGNAKT